MLVFFRVVSNNKHEISRKKKRKTPGNFPSHMVPSHASIDVHESPRHASAPWQVRGLVDFADANKDGKVDPKEVQSAIRLGKVSQKGGGGGWGPTKAEG